MSQNIEIEFKNLLTEAEYNKLYKELNLSEQSSFIQENIYFDTESFSLKQNKAAFRIRIKNGQAELTLKTPHEGHLLETNETISLDKASEIIENKVYYPSGQIKETLSDRGINDTLPLHIFAHLKTKRIEKKVNTSLIVLDQSWYAGQTDFELEIESATSEEGQQLIDELLNNLSIPKRSTPNKIARAYAAMNPGK